MVGAINMNLHNDKIVYLSSIFKKYSLLHQLIKRIYYKLNHLVSLDKNFTYEIINGSEFNLRLKQDKEFFFGYYHNTPWSYDDKFCVLNSVLDSGALSVNIFNIDRSEVVFSDNTTLWNYQQGAMIGWVPFKHIIYYNKLVEGTHKTILYNLLSKQFSQHDFPIQSIHPRGDSYISINYSKLYFINRDYGYKDECKKMSKYESGIWKCYFDKAQSELLISIDMMKQINKDFSKTRSHEFNHCLFSNNGEYFLFIYRYEIKGVKYSKLILADYNSSSINIKVVNNIFISHMCWIDNENIFYFGDSINEGKGYYIYNLISNKSKRIMPKNLNDGHPSIGLNKKWVVIDTYPDRKYTCHLYLYNIETMNIINIGKFKSNIELHGYNRCDLHPRWDNSGTKVMIDSSCNGKRSPIVIDLKEIINE